VAKLEDLREWLLSQIDGSEETRGDDGLISDFIRQIDALPSEMGAIGLEPRGCPTPGACSAVEELADLKQRLLPQANGRAERTEKARQMAVVERDALLENLIVHQTTVANLHDLIDRMRKSAPSATAAPPVEEKAVGHARYEYVRTLNPREFAALYDESLMGVHQFDDLVDRRRVKGEPVECGYDRTASLSAGHYVCTCGGACSSPTTSHRTKEE